MNITIRSQQRPLHIAGLLSALAYLFLCVRSQTEGSVSLTDLWAVSLFCAGLCFSLWNHYKNSRTSAISISGLLAWAMLFRLIGIASFPVMEDDFYRFLWDGRMLVETGSPYLQAPADFFGVEQLSSNPSTNIAMQATLDGINHPDIKTIYGPLTQYIFALGYLIAPGQVWPLQLFTAVLDMLLICVLLKLAPARLVLLYAWCPLVIKEFAFTAHPDIIALLPLMAAMITVQKQQWQRTAILLALAVCGKVFALLLVPLLLRFQWRSWLTFAATVLILTLPLSGGQTPAGLVSMATDWQFNAPIYQLLDGYIPAHTLKITLLCVLCLFWCVYVWKHLQKPENRIPRGDWLFALMLLCSPVLNPWYAIWILPFAVIWPSRWAWTASVAMLLAYASGINMPGSGYALYQQPPWAVVLEFSLIALALSWDMREKIREPEPAPCKTTEN